MAERRPAGYPNVVIDTDAAGNIKVTKAKSKEKPIRLSGELRAKYFTDTDPKEVEDIVDKALAAWFKKRR